MRIILTSKAGGGKDFFRNYLSTSRSYDVSYTTRPSRGGEIDGYTYNFITEDEFKKMESKDEFFENVTFNGWKYGTSRNSWENNEIFILTPSGIAQIPELERQECIVVYLDIDEKIRKERLSKRTDADTVDRRLIADEKDFNNFTDFDIRITNPIFTPPIVLNLIKSYAYANKP